MEEAARYISAGVSALGSLSSFEACSKKRYFLKCLYRKKHKEWTPLTRDKLFVKVQRILDASPKAVFINEILYTFIVRGGGGGLFFYLAACYTPLLAPFALSLTSFDFPNPTSHGSKDFRNQVGAVKVQAKVQTV